jgi:cytochrome c-type biogenesis protein CcsB
MVKRLGKFLFSMQLMAALMILFAVAIAFATFIENDFGTTTAKAVIYNTFWFELIMALLIINFIGNIPRYKFLTKKKLTVFTFHFAFIIILIGAFITRYVGEEGYMHIREGKSTNQMLSARTYLKADVFTNNSGYSYASEVLFSPLTPKRFSKKLAIEDHLISINSLEFIPNAIQQLIPDNKGTAYIELIKTGRNGRESVYIPLGGMAMVYGHTVSFNAEVSDADITILLQNEQLYINSKHDLQITDKDNWTDLSLVKSENHPFKVTTLHKIDGQIFVLKQFMPQGNLVLHSREKDDGPEGPDALKVLVSTEKDQQEVILWGSASSTGKVESVIMGDVQLDLSYGAKVKELPFSLKLNDFILDRYPGSNSPSSFKSKVVLIDSEKGINKDIEIYMNNVLKHRGYRFYQSSYDVDEKGTILSVNNDLPGTLITYLGYLILTLGMLGSLVSKSSRFQLLRKVALAPILLTLLFFSSVKSSASDFSWEDELAKNTVQQAHASNFGRLMVQDKQGRIKPVNTLGSEVLRKIARKNNFSGLSSDQVFLGMLSNPAYWQHVPLIKVSHEGIRELLQMEGKYISFAEITFLNPSRTYQLNSYVEEAYRKKPAYRSKFDNEIIRVDERVNICYVVFMNSLLKIFPLPDDATNTWHTPADSVAFYHEGDTIVVSQLMTLYFQELDRALLNNNFEKADEYLGYLKTYQQKFGEDIMPTPTQQKLEIWYNNAGIFNRLANYYALAGFVLLILNFVNILSSGFNMKWVNRIGLVIIVLLFLLHAAGLIVRWHISGHAPWSNGYEALIYISWATVFAGLIFFKNAPITLPATAVLAFLILHVAHLSWMDPEITTLVPVLKSVWLVIHVAIITASYGFLALAAILALLNLILMIFKSEKNTEQLDTNIMKLSAIIEMTLIVGLYMLTIGTFLGGIWANESWGRYWGWDPKEAWALITVIIYAFIAHMRLIPGLRGSYAFNVASLFGFLSVLMTYFGVNFYLAGLHSYAKGDPLPVPSFVIYTLISLVVIALMAWVNNGRVDKKVFGIK